MNDVMTITNNITQNIQNQLSYSTLECVQPHEQITIKHQTIHIRQEMHD